MRSSVCRPGGCSSSGAWPSAPIVGQEAVRLYGRRFTIEEAFRDTKDARYGLGLSATHIRDPFRRDRLLLIGAMAMALLTCLGAAGENMTRCRPCRTTAWCHLFNASESTCSASLSMSSASVLK